MQVTLSETEKQICNYLAVLRKSNNRKAQPFDKIVADGLDPEYVEREGVMSELAFCKIMDRFPDQVLIIGHRSASKGEDNGDLTANGICVDVKTTKHQKGQLLAVKKNPAIDLIVLMTGENGCYRLAGGMWAEDLYQERRYGIPEKMYRPCYSALQEELITPKNVLKVLNHTSSSTTSPGTLPVVDLTKP